MKTKKQSTHRTQAEIGTQHPVEQNTINIHSILPISEVNGPGKRTVIWVQGCIFRCRGCFNPDLLSFETKNRMTISEIMKAIPLHDVEGVTISGGEPFCQANELAVLAQAIKQAGLSLMVYTGYNYNRIIQAGDTAFKQCIHFIDILVDGPYEENREPDTVWAGSGNQKVIFLTDRYRNYEKRIRLSLPSLKSTFFSLQPGLHSKVNIGNDEASLFSPALKTTGHHPGRKERYVEYHIGKDGTVKITGF